MSSILSCDGKEVMQESREAIMDMRTRKMGEEARLAIEKERATKWMNRTARMLHLSIETNVRLSSILCSQIFIGFLTADIVCCDWNMYTFEHMHHAADVFVYFLIIAVSTVVALLGVLMAIRKKDGSCLLTSFMIYSMFFLDLVGHLLPEDVGTPVEPENLFHVDYFFAYATYPVIFLVVYAAAVLYAMLSVGVFAVHLHKSKKIEQCERKLRLLCGHDKPVFDYHAPENYVLGIRWLHVTRATRISVLCVIIIIAIDIGPETITEFIVFIVFSAFFVSLTFIGIHKRWAFFLYPAKTVLYFQLISQVALMFVIPLMVFQIQKTGISLLSAAIVQVVLHAGLFAGVGGVMCLHLKCADFLTLWKQHESDLKYFNLFDNAKTQVNEEHQMEELSDLVLIQDV